MKSCIVFAFLIFAGFSNISAQSAEVYYSQGYNYSANGEIDNAIESYTKAIQKDPSYKKAYTERGILYSDQGKQEAAMKDFSAALEIDPNYDYARRNRAAIYISNDNYDPAIKDYTRLIQQDSKFPYYYELRGIAYYKTGQKEKALQDFNKSLELAPENEDLQVKRAKLMLELGKEDEAYASLSNSDIQTKELSLESKFHVARSSRKIGEYEKALELLNTLEAKGFKLEKVYLEKGLAYINMEQFENAISAFDNCLAQNPDNEVALINKASAASQSGQYQKAVDTYNKVIQKWGEDHTRALSGRAIAYYASGKVEKACSDWQTAASHGSDNASENIKTYCSKEKTSSQQSTGTSQIQSIEQSSKKEASTTKAQEQLMEDADEVESQEGDLSDDIEDQKMENKDQSEDKTSSKKSKQNKRKKKED